MLEMGLSAGISHFGLLIRDRSLGLRTDHLLVGVWVEMAIRTDSSHILFLLFTFLHYQSLQKSGGFH